MYSDSNKVAMIAYPHADDGELGAGLTVLKLIEKGYAVVNVCMVQDYDRLRGGSKGDWETAANRIGYSDNHMLTFPDCRLPNYIPEMIKELEDLRQQHNPSLVIYPAGKDAHTDTHQDHRAFYEAARVAFREIPVQWTMRLPSTHPAGFNPTEFQHTQDTLMAYQKANALLAYNSQGDIASGLAAISQLVADGRSVKPHQDTLTLEEVLHGSKSHLLDSLVERDPLEIGLNISKNDLRLLYAGHLINHLPGTVFAEPFEPIMTSTSL